MDIARQEILDRHHPNEGGEGGDETQQVDEEAGDYALQEAGTGEERCEVGDGQAEDESRERWGIEENGEQHLQDCESPDGQNPALAVPSAALRWLHQGHWDFGLR